MATKFSEPVKAKGYEDGNPGTAAGDDPATLTEAQVRRERKKLRRVQGEDPVAEGFLYDRDDNGAGLMARGQPDKDQHSQQPRVEKRRKEKPLPLGAMKATGLVEPSANTHLQAPTVAWTGAASSVMLLSDGGIVDSAGERSAIGRPSAASRPCARR